MIEFLSKNDISQILDLYDGNFSDGWNKNMLESAFLNGRFLAIAKKIEQRLVAVITISTTQFDADIEGIVVDKAFRNKGYAKELLEFSENHLKTLGIEKIFLEVRVSNTPARNLYSQNGYSEISIRKKYYSDNEDAVVMAKEI
ncbi:MAG: ribosomal-protein-alanine N-acetyltransferase [Clostridiales bacterium]|nr:ribosomal-protein-alanine N-acetyltransferase [Clostridiales bacterium]